MSTPPTPTDALGDLLDWLGKGDDAHPKPGAKRMTSILRRYGLDSDVFRDQLYNELIDATLRFVERGEVIESVPAWATSVMSRRVKSLVRGDIRLRRNLGARIRDHGEAIDAVADKRPDLADVVADRALVDAMRRALLAVVDDWRLVAGLTMVAVHVDGAEPGSACPRPLGGVDADAHAGWAAAWYAGRRHAFDVPHAAVNRKRDIDATKRILASALEHAGYDRRRDV